MPAYRAIAAPINSRTVIGNSMLGMVVCLTGVPLASKINRVSFFFIVTTIDQAGNKFNVTVGSGGVQIKTGGAVDISGTTVKVSGHKINVQSKAGVNIASDEIIELQSPKNISLRSNKQHSGHFQARGREI